MTQPVSAGNPYPTGSPYPAQAPSGSTYSSQPAGGTPYQASAASGNHAPAPAASPYPPPVSSPYPSADATTPISLTSGGVPQQRGQVGGTVYGTGGYPSIDTTMPVNIDPVENSGSLTGHILAQGWYDAPTEQRRSNLKVVLAMLVVLGLLVTVSLIFVFTAGDAFTSFLGGLS